MLSTGSETKPALLYFSLINRPASLVSLFPQYYSSNSLTLAAVSNLRASNSAYGIAFNESSWPTLCLKIYTLFSSAANTVFPLLTKSSYNYFSLASFRSSSVSSKILLSPLLAIWRLIFIFSSFLLSLSSSFSRLSINS